MALQQESVKSKGSLKSEENVTVTFYTDPLCCWSWAMEPGWQKLQAALQGSLQVKYKMGGLLPSWQHFKDMANSISRPSQMGPEWMTAANISGVAINSRVWITNPPASSYPACIAFKCVQLQSDGMAEIYLRLMRQAVMKEARNIAKTSELISLAEVVAFDNPEFDLNLFQEDLLGERGKEAFRQDLREVKYLTISRFPTLVIKKGNGSTTVLTGFQNFAALWATIAENKSQ